MSAVYKLSIKVSVLWMHQTKYFWIPVCPVPFIRPGNWDSTILLCRNQYELLLTSSSFTSFLAGISFMLFTRLLQ